MKITDGPVLGFAALGVVLYAAMFFNPPRRPAAVVPPPGQSVPALPPQSPQVAAKPKEIDPVDSEVARLLSEGLVTRIQMDGYKFHVNDAAWDRLDAIQQQYFIKRFSAYHRLHGGSVRTIVVGDPSGYELGWFVRGRLEVRRRPGK